ncbi:Gp15 family bacteriophage protein [Anaeromassilibacillus senegalensis]|uniref:Gp15 family bacteriophage protein n=1 Tax=Anaeromassilibacillus senegalensis TaxID=1673717 RepID=UPI0018A7EA5D|nr:Gp15 family bacteriophage protein [Anaeromassilibacillus senegalensis]
MLWRRSWEKHRKLWLNDFRKPQKPKSDAWYDLEYDRILIEQSIAKQYGVLPSDQPDLHYADWAKLVSGLMDDTPLGRVVAVRSEDDPDMLKAFTPEQNRLRTEWKQFCGQKVLRESDEESVRLQMKNLERMIASMFGG